MCLATDKDLKTNLIRIVFFALAHYLRHICVLILRRLVDGTVVATRRRRIRSRWVVHHEATLGLIPKCCF